MYRLRRSASPKAMFAVYSGTPITPRHFADGSNTWMPPGPQQYTLPAESIFMPSGAPGPFAAVSAHDAPPVTAAARRHVEHADVLALGVVDEEPLAVEREAQARSAGRNPSRAAPATPRPRPRDKRRGSRARARA
jgi:hypothetical protein